MRFSLVYTTLFEPSDSQRRAREYLEKVGYVYKLEKASFERGSTWGSRFSFRLKKWHAISKIQASPRPEGGSIVHFDLFVDTKGQFLTGREKKWWLNEVKGFERATEATMIQDASESWPDSVYIGWVTLACSLLGGLLGWIVGDMLLQDPAAAGVGAAVGFGALTSFGYRYDKAKILRKEAAQAKTMQSSGLAPLQPSPDTVTPVIDNEESQTFKPDRTQMLDLKMKREIRSWAIWSGIIGVIQLATSGFQSAWGITLILVALASLVFEAPAMFAVYGISLGWVAFSNLSSGSSRWMFFAVVQFYLAFQVMRMFWQFRPLLQTDLNTPENPHPELARSSFTRPAKFFPVLSFIFSGISLPVFFVCILGAIFLNEETFYAQISGFISYAIELTSDFSMLGIAIGVGALLSKYRLKGLSIAGVIMGAITLCCVIGLTILSFLG